MRRIARMGLACAFFALASCEEAVDVDTSPAEGMDAQPEVVLPQPSEKGAYLFWTPEEQLVGYRRIEKIFDTRTVKAGGTSSLLTW